MFIYVGQLFQWPKIVRANKGNGIWNLIETIAILLQSSRFTMTDSFAKLEPHLRALRLLWIHLIKECRADVGQE